MNENIADLHSSPNTHPVNSEARLTFTLQTVTSQRSQLRRGREGVQEKRHGILEQHDGNRKLWEKIRAVDTGSAQERAI